MNQEIRLSDWEQQIGQIFERLDNPRHYRLIFEKVHKEQLIDMCNECKFNIYDTSKWYRFNKDLQSHDLLLSLALKYYIITYIINKVHPINA